MDNALQIIDNFNTGHAIQDVIEQLTGITIKGKSFPCPIHGGDNPHGASINIADNIFTCWTHDCGRGLTPWNFIARYYNLNNFQEVAEKINSLFNTNIPIYLKNDMLPIKKAFIKPTTEFNAVLKNTGKYMSDISHDFIYQSIKDYRHIVLQAPTGLGKTHSLTTIAEVCKYKYNLDYIFFLTPTRSIVENVSSTYNNYEKFYGDDTEIRGKLIVSTYHKATLINKEIDSLYEYRALLKEIELDKDISYMVIVDECHELLSKRNILGVELCKEIEKLIINSDYSVCMSANTTDFINAYKGTGLYNYTLNIEPKEINYNANNFYIYRCSSTEKIRLKQISDKVIEFLGTKEHILISIDNIEELKHLSNVLTGYDIDNKVIDSKNKGDEEVEKEYLSIVNDSKLKTTVVLCTSVINAGVNIKNKNVLTIAYQNKRAFDINKLEQFFGRVRTSINNDIILFLNQSPKDLTSPTHVISSVETKFHYNISKTEILLTQLNEEYFNNYYSKDDDFKKHLSLISGNDEYRSYEPYFYIENKIVKLDRVGLYEKSRLEWLMSNYYNDDFIKEMLKDVKSKNKPNIVYLCDTNKIDIDLKEDEEEKKDLEFYLTSIKENKESLIEFSTYLNKTIKSKDFKNQVLKQMYEEHKNNDKYKGFIKELKRLYNGLDDGLYDLRHLKHDILLKVIDIFLLKNEKGKPLSKAKRDILITNLKRSMIYNKMYPLNVDVSRYENLGDIEYYYIRSLDKLCNSRNKPSNKQLKSLLNNILKAKHNIYVLDTETFENAKYKHNKAIEQQQTYDIMINNISGSWYNTKGKKIDFQRELESLKDIIKVVYNCTNELYIKQLK